MLLTKEQYCRGLVKWEGGSDAVVTVGAKDGSVQSTPITDSQGAILDVVVADPGHIHFELLPSENMSLPSVMS